LSQGFLRLDVSLLNSPRFTATADLDALVRVGPNVGFSYLLDLKERELVVSAKLARLERIERLRSRLLVVEACLQELPFPGASTWAIEIENVIKAVALGVKTRWRFTD
jgi:hypothetical protein